MRKPWAERWNRENIGRIKGVPWTKNADEERDGEQMKTEVVVMDEEYKDRMSRTEHEAVPRQVFISKGDLDDNGYTVGCLGAYRF